MKSALNVLSLIFFGFVVLVLIAGVASYFAHPTPELAGALAGVLGPIFFIVLCILGFVLIGRRRP